MEEGGSYKKTDAIGWGCLDLEGWTAICEINVSVNFRLSKGIQHKTLVIVFRGTYYTEENSCINQNYYLTKEQNHLRIGTALSSFTG